MKTSRRLSLRQRLLVWLLLPILILTGIWGWAVYAIVIHFANLAYDRALEDTVETLAAQVGTQHGGFQVDLPVAARRMVEFDRVDRIYYSIADGNGVVYAGNGQIPALPGNPEMPHGTLFYDSSIDGRDVRVAERAIGEKNFLTIRVAETRVKRSILAREVLFYMIGPQLLFLGGIILLVWVGVGRGIAPLVRVRQAISSRSPDDLGPLVIPALPTEVEEQVRAINELMTRLDTVLMAQRRFIADAAHQLRTPAATLRTQVELAMRTIENKESQAFLAKLDTTSARIVRLTGQLLDLSRAEAGQSGAIASEPLDIADLVRTTIAWFVPEALAKGIDISVDLQEGMLPLRGNRHLLEQMLANLVDNAVRYNRKGNVVCVEGHQVNGVLTLSVEDDGPGIPDHELRLVFERFYRPPASPSGGSGLGLAIAAEAVSLHHGHITLEPSRKETGLRVIVTIPITALSDG